MISQSSTRLSLSSLLLLLLSSPIFSSKRSVLLSVSANVYRNMKRIILKKITFVSILLLLMFTLIISITFYSDGILLSVYLTQEYTGEHMKRRKNQVDRIPKPISGIDHDALMVNSTGGMKRQRNVAINPKRHLGSLVTNLFDQQGFKLKKTFDMNNLVLFPFETDNPFEDDRILAQMSYVPVQVLQARLNGHVRKKRIHYYHKSSYSLPNLSVCPVYECDVSSHEDSMQNADLVIFESHPPDKTNIPTNQSWLLYHIESPQNFPFTDSKDRINFTATYTIDSTIVTPYYKYVTFADVELKDSSKRIKLLEDYSVGKTKLVAWFVSNCAGISPRLKYAKELQKYIQVDIYGMCGDLSCSRGYSKCFNLLKTDYKFYLSFENSICQDYISEKFFENALKNTVIPVVMGASKQEVVRSAPPNSFIHVDDFNSAKELADYLHYLDRNKTAYNEYFKWYNHGFFDFNTFTDCRLCMLAHEIDNFEYPYWYKDLGQWRQDQCRNRKLPIIV
ncbi:Glycoprotein 3-alpha-L-fucosyltransferase A isoform 2 [Schistosoma japonicum]|uniref:Fucosyltransferase n=3 Tax=Schistosoma japonicum TaxID=6182 RepID=A0A4Z2CUG9_SCHJA|nr:Glycoprotein 3-alpha-L-fucosyltransferase A isoform 2 [Schistosoma japonicum]